MLFGFFSLRYGFAAAFAWIYVISLGITAVSCGNTNSIASLSGQQPEIRHADMILHKSANRVTIKRDLPPSSVENLKTQKTLISKRESPNDQHGQNTNKDNTGAQTSSSQNNNSASTPNETNDSQTNKQQGTQSSNSAASTDNQQTQKPDNVSSSNNDQQQSDSSVSTDSHQQGNSTGSDKPQITADPTNNDHQQQPTATDDNKHENSPTKTAAANSITHQHEESQQPTATGDASSPSNTVNDNNKNDQKQETATNDNHTATTNDANHSQPTATDDSGRSHPNKGTATATDQAESVTDYTQTTYIVSTTDDAHTTHDWPSATTNSNDHDSTPVTEQQATTSYESTATAEIVATTTREDPTTTAKDSQSSSQEVSTTTTQYITTTSKYLATASTDRTTTSDEISSSIDKYSSTATRTKEETTAFETTTTSKRETTIVSTAATTDDPATTTTSVVPTTATSKPTSSNVDDTFSSSLTYESSSFSFTTSEAFDHTVDSTSPTTTDALSSAIAAMATSPENSDTTTMTVAEQALTTSFSNGADTITTLSSSDPVKTPTASITYYPTSTRLFSVSSSTATPLLVLGSAECTSDPHAVNGKCPYQYFCNAAKRSCVWLLENNQQCYEDFQCASTYCTNGVCVPSGSINKSNNGGKIAGATIGGLVGACLVLFALIRWRRRSRAIGRRMNRFNEEKFYDATSEDKKKARLSKFNFLTQMLDNNHSAVQLPAADLSNQQYKDHQLYAAQPSAHSHFTNQQEPQIYHADQQQSTGSSPHQIHRIPIAASERPKPSVVTTQSSYNPFRQTSTDNDAWSKEDEESMSRATYGYI